MKNGFRNKSKKYWIFKLLKSMTDFYTNIIDYLESGRKMNAQSVATGN